MYLVNFSSETFVSQAFRTMRQLNVSMGQIHTLNLKFTSENCILTSTKNSNGTSGLIGELCNETFQKTVWKMSPVSAPDTSLGGYENYNGITFSSDDYAKSLQVVIKIIVYMCISCQTKGIIKL